MPDAVTPVTYGIKETKELLVGVNELSVFLVERLKDGAQVGDAVALIDKLKNDPDFQAKLAAAYDQINQVPAEVKDLSLMEGIELVMVQANYVPKIIEAAKKPAVVVA